MKPIKIRHFCRPPILIMIILPFAIQLSIAGLILGFKSQNKGLICVSVIALLFIVAGLHLYAIYGIKITNKKVRICYHDIYETFRYEDINYMKIGFNDHAIWGEVKAFRQKPIEFCMVDFCSIPSSLIPGLWMTNVKITKRKAKRILKDLSGCEKIRLEYEFED